MPPNPNTYEILISQSDETLRAAVGQSKHYVRSLLGHVIREGLRDNDRERVGRYGLGVIALADAVLDGVVRYRSDGSNGAEFEIDEDLTGAVEACARMMLSRAKPPPAIGQTETREQVNARLGLGASGCVCIVNGVVLDAQYAGRGYEEAALWLLLSRMVPHCDPVVLRTTPQVMKYESTKSMSPGLYKSLEVWGRVLGGIGEHLGFVPLDGVEPGWMILRPSDLVRPTLQFHDEGRKVMDRFSPMQLEALLQAAGSVH